MTKTTSLANSVVRRNDYECQFHALFIYLIPEDVLPGDSKAIGIICALLNLSYPELYSPEKKKKTTTTASDDRVTASVFLRRPVRTSLNPKVSY